MADGKTARRWPRCGKSAFLSARSSLPRLSSSRKQARAIAVEQVRLDLMVERLEQEYPQINPDADEYDQDLVDEVMELRICLRKSR
jgi:hypothetical protein